MQLPSLFLVLVPFSSHRIPLLALSRTTRAIRRCRAGNRGRTRQIKDLRRSRAPTPTRTIRRRSSGHRLPDTRARPGHPLQLQTRRLGAERRPRRRRRDAARRPDASRDGRAGPGRRSRRDGGGRGLAAARLRREGVARPRALGRPAGVGAGVRYRSCWDGGAAPARDGDGA